MGPILTVMIANCSNLEINKRSEKQKIVRVQESPKVFEETSSLMEISQESKEHASKSSLVSKLGAFQPPAFSEAPVCKGHTS